MNATERVIIRQDTFLDDVLREFPYAIAVFDAQMRYLAWSRRWLEDYHLNADEPLRGRSHYEVFPEINEEWRQLHRDCLAGVTLSRDDDPFPRRDGSLDYVSWKLVPWYREEGGVGGLIMYTAVSTPQVVAEKLNRHYEREIQALLEATRAVPWRLDLNSGSFSHIGPNIEALLGYPAESWRDMDVWASRIHPDDRDYALEQCLGQTAQGNDHDMEYRAISAWGKSVWIRDAVSVSKGADGQAVALSGLFIDISAQKEAERRIHQSKREYRSVIETSGDGFWLTDGSGVILETNDAYARLSGYSKEELVGMHISDLDAEEQTEDTTRRIGEIIRNGSALFESRHRRKSGELWDVEISTSFSPSNGGRFFVFTRDISERKQNQQELRLVAEVFKSSSEGIVITDPQGVIVKVNDAYCDIMGYERDEIIGATPSKVKSDRHDKDFYRIMWQSLKEGGHWVGEVWDRRKNGEVFPKWLSINAVHDDKGELTHYVGTFSDISELKGAEQELQQMAYYDPLTRLPNRILFQDRCENELSNSRRFGYQCAVLFIDLDRFKLINDTLGHAAGDELLIEVSQRLRNKLRAADTVARMGGDEFTVLLTRLQHSDAAAVVAQGIIDELLRPMTLQGEEVRVGASIGIAIYPGDGDNYTTLTRRADAAMYEAKKCGRGQYHFYSDYMDRRAHDYLSIERDLRQALEQEQFSLAFQPQVDAASGQVVHCEALIRWHHPQRGKVAPEQFIHIAEDTGLIIPIGEWVVEEVCRCIAAWKGEEVTVPSIAINLSARQFAQGDLQQRILSILDHHGVNVSEIALEITESVAMENAESTLQRLTALAESGFSIAIDDFGTGYSSLSYLKTFPVDKLKLDRSFVMDIPEDSNDVAIASAVIQMANSLELEVVAEGVETTAQRDFLLAEGCRIMQGFLFSKPLPAGELVDYLRRQDADKWSD